MSEQTVRELRASVREWCEDVDEMVTAIGHDRWLDIPCGDLKRIGESMDVGEDIISLLQAWGEMASTRQQIASLPTYDDETRMA